MYHYLLADGSELILKVVPRITKDRACRVAIREIGKCIWTVRLNDYYRCAQVSSGRQRLSVLYRCDRNEPRFVAFHYSTSYAIISRSAREHTADGGFAGTGDAHQDDDHGNGLGRRAVRDDRGRRGAWIGRRALAGSIVARAAGCRLGSNRRD